MIRLLMCLLLAGPALAQEIPPPLSPYVSDYADLLPEADEAALTERLQALCTEHGIEMAVVTIDRRADYGASDSIETFATGLFNAWGIGDARRNDGILFLVARGDRETRIELGAGYDPAWDWQARLVLDDHVLPAFKAENYVRGILVGSDHTIRRIALAHAEGAPPPEDSDLGGLALFGAGLLAMLGLAFRGPIADRLARFRRCPNCGTLGLRARRETLSPPTRAEAGEAARHLSCPNCAWHDTTHQTLPRLRDSKDNDSGFGGGSSSGGGASGRW